MAESRQPVSRGTFVRSIVVLPALATLTYGVAAADSSKVSQASMHYQTTPNDGKHCSLCKFFVPAQDPSANGTCQIVDGSISPNGYCQAFAAPS
jgi:High potential iron-sulfur protein